MRDRLVDLFGWFKEHRIWAAAIALVNLVGIAYGFYYYGDQFTITPAWLWGFVPDSPLAVLWAELALLAYWLVPAARRGRWLWLDALAFVGNVQVGLWTTYVLVAYEPAFHTLDFLQGEGPMDLNTILWVGHLGMAALGLIFVKGIRDATPAARWTAIGVAAASYVANDILDYFGPDFVGRGCGMRPFTVPCNAAQETTLTIVTFALTAGSVLALIWLTRPKADGERR